MKIFADPAVQSVYDEIILGNVPGDVVAGIKAYAKGLDRHYWPTNATSDNECDARIKAFQSGYDGATQDQRYQILRNLALSFKE
jgi:hypothetical protein